MLNNWVLHFAVSASSVQRFRFVMVVLKLVMAAAGWLISKCHQFPCFLSISAIADVLDQQAQAIKTHLLVV